MSQLKWQVLQWAGRIAKYAQLSALSERFGFGYVSLPIANQQLGEKGAQQRVRFLQDFGFRSRPVVSGGECVVVAPRAGATNAIALAADNLGHGPTDLKEGEVAVYCKVNGTVIRLTEDGLSLAAASPKDVTVNGGTQPVARQGDAVQIKPKVAGGALALWMSQVEAFINGAAAGTVTPLSDTFVGGPGLTIKDGAPHFKA